MDKRNNIFNRVDNFFTKLALYRVKEILLTEKGNEYYRNNDNIKEQIELSSDKYIDKYGREITETESIVYWNNGFFDLKKTLKYVRRNK